MVKHVDSGIDPNYEIVRVVLLSMEHERLRAAAEQLLLRHSALAFSREALVLIADTFAKGNAPAAERILAGFEQMLSCSEPRPKDTVKAEFLDTLTPRNAIPQENIHE